MDTGVYASLANKHLLSDRDKDAIAQASTKLKAATCDSIHVVDKLPNSTFEVDGESIKADPYDIEGQPQEYAIIGCKALLGNTAAPTSMIGKSVLNKQ